MRTAAGHEILIRPIRPDDDGRLNAAYDRLSPLSQYRRFHAAKPHLSESETRYLVDVDGIDHFALVAIAADDPGEIAGVARFVRLPEDARSAEIAVTVGDPYQRQGLASAMLERLADAALARGIRRFRATMLSENVPAQRMVRRLSRGHGTERGLGAIKEIEVDLAARARHAPLR